MVPFPPPVRTFTQQKVGMFLAMTGEITLGGHTTCRGINEKILAVKRAGIKALILSPDDRKDIDTRYTRGMRFTDVNEMIEVVKHALLKEKVENALKVA